MESICARFGIKSFKLCEAESGYVWNFIVYVGKETVFDENVRDETYYGSKVVLDLMAPLLNQGYCVTMGNWFSSPDLKNYATKIQMQSEHYARTERECLQK